MPLNSLLCTGQPRTVTRPAHRVCSAKEEGSRAAGRETATFRDEQFGVTTKDIEVIKCSSLPLSAGDTFQDSWNCG